MSVVVLGFLRTPYWINLTPFDTSANADVLWSFFFFCWHCKEYKDLRLTGGLDRCSGRVEIHRNGSWGTVCDECWDKEEALMACKMLGCGEPKQYTAFEPPFLHKNNTRWFYMCTKNSNILWDCKELDASLRNLCPDPSAAGLICNSK